MALYTSKADAAYAHIRGQIMDGTLEAGSKLAQYELADALGVSITPLREAIRRLSGEGWIMLDAHRNARVAGLDLAEAQELFETRRALEPAAVELAAGRRTEADIARIESTLAALLPVTREWGEPALAAHKAFHEALHAASHNQVMVRLLGDLWDRSDRYRRLGLTLPPGGEPRTRDLDEHRQIADLVIAGDGAGAAALMTSHIDNSLTSAAIAHAGQSAEDGNTPG